MSVRLALAFVLFVGCGCGGESDQAAGRGTPRVDRCTDRVLELVKDEPVTDQLRRYARTAYCEPFDRRGWVYDDGTLSIDAYRRSGTAVCMGARPGQPSTTIPCSPEPEPILDCALLHLVRRGEVRAYLEEIQQTRNVECDDGTPLDQLGADG